jgi:poly-gamma-glutamate synthesis protein (capsule biosynthesis protein)
MVNKSRLKNLLVPLALGFLILPLIIVALIKKEPQEVQEIEKEIESIPQKIKEIFATPETTTHDSITNLNQVFESVDSAFEIEDSASTVSIISTGDIMLGRTVNYKTLTYKDFTWAFKNIADLLKSGDLTYVNLENPLVANCPTKNEGMIFCAPNDHIQGLLFAGVDAASLANNHAYNYSTTGLNNTEQVLTENKILVTGIKNPTYTNVKNLKIALLGYDDVECYPNSIACLEKDKLTSEIKEARANADLVIIMFHWGTEYTHQPTSRQIEFAHLSIDSGADLVLGNHPHWYQPLEIYKEKLIAYSHGNTVFDQMWSEKTKEGFIMKSTFDVKAKKLVDVKIYPTYIKDYGQPTLLEEKERARIIGNLKIISNHEPK